MMYEELFKIQDLFRFRLVSEDNKIKYPPLAYEKLVCRGDNFPLFDYGVGLYCLTIKIIPSYNTGLCSCLFSVSNIDDGLWQAWGPDEEQCLAWTRIDKLKEIFGDVNRFSTEEQLNGLLRNVGMFGYLQ